MQETQKQALPHVNHIEVYHPNAYIVMDAVTRRNLEIEENIQGDDKYTLLHVLDKTVTAKGSRLLREWLKHPLQDRKNIIFRQNVTDAIIGNYAYDALKKMLQHTTDIERIAARILLKSAKPTDFSSLQKTLLVLPDIKNYLDGMKIEEINIISNNILPLKEIECLLSKAIIDNPPQSIRDGGFIKSGYDENLDALRELSINANKLLIEYESQQKELTGIQNLKVGYLSLIHI